MNLQTYLMIKSAYYDGMEKEATNRTAMAARSKARKGGAGRGEAKRIGEAAVEEAKTAPTVAPVAHGAGAPFVVGFDPLQQAMVDNNELSSQLRGAERELAGLRKDKAFLKNKREELENQNKTLGFDLTRSNMNLEGMRNNRDALYDAADANKAFGDAMHGRLLTTNKAIGGTVGGLAGAGLGYAGSSWLSKKLGLQGPNVSRKRRIADIALRTLGTAGVGALGAYGGSRLGGYMTPANTMAALPNKYVEITGA